MKRLLASLVTLCALTAGAQTDQAGRQPATIAGTLYASNFSYWSVPMGNMGPFQWSNRLACTANSGGVSFTAFKVGTPVLLVDPNPALTEVITPTQVTIGNTGCQFSATTINPHTSFYLTTSSAGLQEAINYAAGLSFLVYITNDFTRVGGLTSTIVNAKGNTAVSIWDQRASVPVSYVWNGSVYVGTAISGGGGNCPVGTAGQLQYYASAGNCGGAPADWNQTNVGMLSLNVLTTVGEFNPIPVPFLTFSDNPTYSLFTPYLTQSLLTNDSSLPNGPTTSVTNSHFQEWFPGFAQGVNNEVYLFGSEQLNMYDYTDGIGYGWLLNGTRYGAGDTNWFDIQTDEANTDIVAASQGSSMLQLQRTEQGYGGGPYTNTVASGGGGPGQTTLTLVTSGCCSQNAIGFHRPLIDKTTGVITTTLTSFAPASLANSVTVESATSSATLVASVQGTLAQAINVSRIPSNTTGELSAHVVTFNVNITTPPTANTTLCTVISHNGPGVDWIKPTAVTLVSTGVYALTATVFYSHSSGDTVFCGGTMGFLEETNYTNATSYQARYLLEVYGATSTSTLVFGIQTPAGPQSTYGQSGTQPAKIYQGGEIVGSLNPATGQPDGGEIVIYPNNAAWANADAIEVDNFLVASYAGIFSIQNLDNPWAYAVDQDYFWNGTGGMLNGNSAHLVFNNALPYTSYAAGGGYGLAPPLLLSYGVTGGGMAMQSWPTNDAPGGGFPGMSVPRGVLIGVGGWASGSGIGSGTIWSLPDGGLLTYTTSASIPTTSYDLSNGGSNGSNLQSNSFSVQKSGCCGPYYFGMGAGVATPAIGTSISSFGYVQGFGGLTLGSVILPGTGIVSFSQAGSPLTTDASITHPSSGDIGVTGSLFDMSAVTQIKAPIASNYTSAANGELGYDSNNKNWHAWVNGADRLLIPLASGFVSGDCGEPSSSGGSWIIADSGSACGSGGSGTSVEINGGSGLGTANFNSSTPAAGTNGINVTWQVSGSSVSAEVVGDGNSAHFLNGTGTYTTPSGSSGYFTGTPTVAVTGTPSAGEFWVATSASAATLDLLLTDNGTTFTYTGTGGMIAPSFSGSSTSVNGALSLTYKGTGAAAPSTNTFQISPAVSITTPWSLSPAAAPFTGFPYFTNSAGVVQETSATASEITTLIQTLTGCNTATNVYTPQGNDCVAPAVGTVTSIATTGPITGGTITTTGTIACATCVVASSPGAGVAHFAGSTQTVTSSAVSLTADVSGILPAANGGSGVANTATHTLGTSNQNWATIGTGIVKVTTTTGAISDAAAADVYGLWSGTCSSTTFLRGDGACAAPSGSGTINAAAQYDVPYYSGSGSATTVSGAAISGFQFDSTSGVPAAATATNLGALANIAQYDLIVSGGTSAAFAGIAPSSTSGYVLTSNGAGANPTFQAPGGVSGSGTANYYALWSGSTSLGNGHLDDGVSTSTVITSSEAFTAAGALTSASDGVHAGYNSLVGNTANYSVSSNTAGFMGPASASFTAWVAQLPATGPTAINNTLQCGAVVSSVSPCVFTPGAGMTVTTGTSATLSTTYTTNEEATAGQAVAYTLPTAAAGIQMCVSNGYNGSAANTGALTVNASAAGQYIIYSDGTLSASGGYVLSGGAARDGACFVGVDSTHWLFYSNSPSGGTWAKH